MIEDKKKESHDSVKIMEAVSYATGSNGVEGLFFSEEELKRIHADVQAGKGEKSFLMAVLDYVKKKKSEQEVLAGEGRSYGKHNE